MRTRELSLLPGVQRTMKYLLPFTLFKKNIFQLISNDKKTVYKRV